MTDTPRIGLVTGGSRGIGRDIALALSKICDILFVNYATSKESAEVTVKMCIENGCKSVYPLQFDVSDSQAVEDGFNYIKNIAGGLDVLVNNAGVTSNNLLLRTKDIEWDKIISINLTGVFYCCRAATKLLIKSSNPRIVNIGSVVGEMGNAGQVAYTSAKAGLIGLTKTLAKELGGRGVTVNCVTPGFIDTEMTADLNLEKKSQYLNGISLNRFGTASEVASLVRFLASTESGYITGQVIGINGGLYM
jgi:3-oxoacyl-[acyl-carrier protein] reductase